MVELKFKQIQSLSGDVDGYGDNNTVKSISGSGGIVNAENSIFVNLNGIVLNEQSSVPAGAPNTGVFWVKDDNPTVPIFTDSDGVDHDILTSAGAVASVTSSDTNTISISPTTGNVVVSTPNIKFVSTSAFVGLNISANGISNAVFGSHAGQSLTTGNTNTFIGAFSGQNNTIGVNNVFLGFRAGNSVTTGSNNILIGPNVAADGSTNIVGTNNSIIIGQSIGAPSTSSKTGFINIGGMYLGYTVGTQAKTALGATVLNDIETQSARNSMYGVGLTEAPLSIRQQSLNPSEVKFWISGAATPDLANITADPGDVYFFKDDLGLNSKIYQHRGAIASNDPNDYFEIGAYGQITLNGGSPLKQQKILNIIEGDNVSISIDDDSVNNRTNITITSSDSGGLDGYVENGEILFGDQDNKVTGNSSFTFFKFNSDPIFTLGDIGDSNTSFNIVGSNFDISFFDSDGYELSKIYRDNINDFVNISNSSVTIRVNNVLIESDSVDSKLLLNNSNTVVSSNFTSQLSGTDNVFIGNVTINDSSVNNLLNINDVITADLSSARVGIGLTSPEDILLEDSALTVLSSDYTNHVFRFTSTGANGATSSLRIGTAAANTIPTPTDIGALYLRVNNVFSSPSFSNTGLWINSAMTTGTANWKPIPHLSAAAASNQVPFVAAGGGNHELTLSNVLTFSSASRMFSVRSLSSGAGPFGFLTNNNNGNNRGWFGYSPNNNKTILATVDVDGEFVGDWAFADNVEVDGTAYFNNIATFDGAVTFESTVTFKDSASFNDILNANSGINVVDSNIFIDAASVGSVLSGLIIRDASLQEKGKLGYIPDNGITELNAINGEITGDWKVTNPISIGNIFNDGDINIQTTSNSAGDIVLSTGDGYGGSSDVGNIEFNIGEKGSGNPGRVIATTIVDGEVIVETLSFGDML